MRDDIKTYLYKPQSLYRDSHAKPSRTARTAADRLLIPAIGLFAFLAMFFYALSAHAVTNECLDTLLQEYDCEILYYEDTEGSSPVPVYNDPGCGDRTYNIKPIHVEEGGPCGPTVDGNEPHKPLEKPYYRVPVAGGTCLGEVTVDYGSHAMQDIIWTLYPEEEPDGCVMSTTQFDSTIAFDDPNFFAHTLRGITYQLKADVRHVTQANLPDQKNQATYRCDGGTWALVPTETFGECFTHSNTDPIYNACGQTQLGPATQVKIETYSNCRDGEFCISGLDGSHAGPGSFISQGSEFADNAEMYVVEPGAEVFIENLTDDTACDTKPFHVRNYLSKGIMIPTKCSGDGKNFNSFYPSKFGNKNYLDRSQNASDWQDAVVRDACPDATFELCPDGGKTVPPLTHPDCLCGTAVDNVAGRFRNDGNPVLSPIAGVSNGQFSDITGTVKCNNASLAADHINNFTALSATVPGTPDVNISDVPGVNDIEANSTVQWKCQDDMKNEPTCTAHWQRDGECGVNDGDLSNPANALYVNTALDDASDVGTPFTESGNNDNCDLHFTSLIDGAPVDNDETNFFADDSAPYNVHWQCDGTNGGATLNCDAPRRLDGLCGPKDGQKFREDGDFNPITGTPEVNEIADDMCAYEDDADDPDFIGPHYQKVDSATFSVNQHPTNDSLNTITWNCEGVHNGANSAQCEAVLERDGECGPNALENSTPGNKNFYAAGENGGVDELILTTSGNCDVGVPQNFQVNAYSITWECGGINGGVIASCTANRNRDEIGCGSNDGQNFYSLSSTNSNNCPFSGAPNAAFDEPPAGPVKTFTRSVNPWDDYNQNANYYEWGCEGTFDGADTADNACRANINRDAVCHSNSPFAPEYNDTDLPSGYTNLCDVASGVSGFSTDDTVSGGSIIDSNFEWTCYGHRDGDDTNPACTSPRRINGSCGSRDGTIQTSLSSTSTGLCDVGQDSGFTFNSTNYTWTWTCDGVNGGISSNDGSGPGNVCQAVRIECDTTPGDCSPGSSSSFTGYTWSSAGATGCPYTGPLIGGQLCSDNIGDSCSPPGEQCTYGQDPCTGAGNGADLQYAECTGSGWECTHDISGDSINCSAPPPPTDPATCGTADTSGTSYIDFDSIIASSDTICGTGSSLVPNSEDDAGNPITWTCVNTASGNTTSCDAPKDLPPACGAAADNFPADTTYNAFDDTVGSRCSPTLTQNPPTEGVIWAGDSDTATPPYWSWNCRKPGFSDVLCFAEKKPATCGTSAGGSFVSSGDISDHCGTNSSLDGSVSLASGTYEWTCRRDNTDGTFGNSSNHKTTCTASESSGASCSDGCGITRSHGETWCQWPFSGPSIALRRECDNGVIIDLSTLAGTCPSPVSCP